MRKADRERLFSLLEDIKAALWALVPDMDEGQEPDSCGCDVVAECDHPSDRRIMLTAMTGGDHWVCRECGFEYRMRPES